MKAKTKALPDYYKVIRIPVAPPGFSMKSKKDYDRKKEKGISYE